jgi:hypothetical protein
MGLSDLPRSSQVIPDLGFTQQEIDMVYFACLAHIGHPQTVEMELNDDGFEALLAALVKIKAHMDSLYLDGEPEVLSVD